MEYEVYWLCNLLGLIIIATIILFHFIESDKKPKQEQQNVKHEIK